MSSTTELHGIALRFDSADQLTAATHAFVKAGYRDLEAYSPYPLEEVDELLQRKSKLASVALICGILGGLSGFYLEYYISAVLYPVNVGGRPLLSWPAFIPITFECTILGSALGIFTAFFFFTKLPQPYHPIFAIPSADRITDDQFVLCLEATDPKFERAREDVIRIARETSALEVVDVAD